MNSSLKIYMFDNATGVEIPEKIDVYPVELVLGKTVSEVHNAMDNSQLFCIFTPVSEADIIVQTKADADMMESTLKFGKRDYSVAVKESSIWYTNKADKNIIISNTVNLPASDLATLLRLYLNEVRLKKKADGKLVTPEIYTVYNIRNSKTIMKTPDITEAQNICNKNPCCIILNRAGDEIYKSGFGKSRALYTKKDFTNKFKAMQDGNNGVFKIVQK